MSAERAFLQLIWPPAGPYCIAHPFRLPNNPKTLWSHKAFDTLAEAADYCERVKSKKEVFFAVLSIKEGEKWEADRFNHTTGTNGKMHVSRAHANMHEARCYFWDMDVGDDPKKYPTQQAAIDDLTKFVKHNQLPQPTVVSSGRGLHVYWHIETPLAVPEWKPTATNLKNLGIAQGVKLDPSRTDDESSVLRVAGTYHRKDPNNPRPVKVLAYGPVSSTANFLKLVANACIRHGDLPAPPRQSKNVGAIPEHLRNAQSNMANEEWDPVEIKDLVTTCQMSQYLIRNQKNLSEPAWYHGLNLFRFCEDGRKLCHHLSSHYPNYDPAETDLKLDHLEAKGVQPVRCDKLRYAAETDEPCQGCKFLNDEFTPNPIMAVRKNAVAPQPVVQPSVQLQEVGVTPDVTIPDPPAGFKRLKSGGVARVYMNQDNEEITQLIFPHDLYPLRRMTHTSEGGTSVGMQVWRVHLPRGIVRDFQLEAEALYDTRKFTATLANNGLYPRQDDVAHLKDYMTLYVRKLQDEVDEERMHAHLGWIDDFQAFVTPTVIAHRDGRITESQLTVNAQRASRTLTTKGTLEEQVKLFSFYNHPEYITHQFFICSALGAMLFAMTPQHGVIVNASGISGASKSTSLRAAANLIGSPHGYVINGTRKGGTENAKLNRFDVIANYPICVDEITHMDIRDVQDLVMGVTEGQGRLRLNPDGSEKEGIGSYRATMMLSSANTSLHSVLSFENAAGTAGSMRVIELLFPQVHVHTKSQADDFLQALEQNYGHIGQQFILYMMNNYDAIKKRVKEVSDLIDQRACILQHERYWSYGGACTIVAAEIAYKLGLLPYDPVALLEWYITNQIPYMRGVVDEEYATPIDVLTDYLAHINGAILVANNLQTYPSDERNYIVTPKYSLQGQFDHTTGKCLVLRKGFKDYCQRIGANSTRIINELHQPRDGGRVILKKRERKTLGAGTQFVTHQQNYCFEIDMTHPLVSGKVRLENVPGSAQGDGKPQAQLTIVRSGGA